MSHIWVKEGPGVWQAGNHVKHSWRCSRCGESISTQDDEVPDPEEVFWRGVASEVDTCDDLVVLHVMDS